MVHLEVTNKPKALKGKIITHRNITCVAFEYTQEKREIAIYEDFKQWFDKTPGYWIINVETITYWDDNI